MAIDVDAMVVAHKAGRQLYWNEAGKNISPVLSVLQLATATYKTVDERIAFVSGYFQEKKRASGVNL